jgi:hypothetical protein
MKPVEARMRVRDFSFGLIRINGITYKHDVVIEQGEVRKREKKPSKKFREDYGHTPLSLEESIPWKCQRLVVGTGVYGGLPVMKDVKLEAERHKIELLILPTAKAIKELERNPDGTNAILHVTC